MNEKSHSAKSPQLPRMTQEEMAPILRRAIEKIERNEPLLHGESSPGVTYLERDVVIATLRAIADGVSLGTVFRRGAPSRHHWGVLYAVAQHQREHPGATMDAAYRAVGRKQGKTGAAVKKSHQRAEKKERDRHREDFLEGRWPDWHYWDMTDDDIERAAIDEPFQYVDKAGNPVDIRDYYRMRRAHELDDILRMTGWTSLPSRRGQK